MTTKRKPSLASELKALPRARTGAKRWYERLGPKARKEFDELKASYQRGEIVCPSTMIVEAFYKRFPDAPRVERCQFIRGLKEH